MCTYTTKEWDHIREHDSVGLNSWIIHDFVPTFYVGEFSRRPSEVATYVHNLKLAADDYRPCYSIFKHRSASANAAAIHEFGGRVAIVEPFRLWSESSRLGAPFRSRLRARGNPPRLLQITASVDLGILLGAYLGYRDVILCGVDLNHTEYFYEVDRDKYEDLGYRIPVSGQAGPVHRTNDPRRGPSGMTLEAAVRMIRSRAEAPRLHVARASSALHPAVPVYGWEAP